MLNNLQTIYEQIYLNYTKSSLYKSYFLHEIKGKKKYFPIFAKNKCPI